MTASKRAKHRLAAVAPHTDGAEPWQLVFAGVALGILILIAYSNSFDAGLVLDNKPLIAMDPRIQSWSADTLKLIFTHDYWWPERPSDLYRPLTTLSYWFNYTVLSGATDVLGYHVVNFLLHWANAVLVLLIVKRLSGRFPLALVAAALFAVHPVNTEAVTNIVGRADLLAALSVLLGGWCYLRARGRRGEGRSGRWWLVGTGVCALVGVFMKETAVLIGVFVVLYDWIFSGERGKGRAGEWVAGYLALVPAAVAFVCVRVTIGRNIAMLGQTFVDNPLVGAGWLTGFMTAWKVLARDLALFVFPHTLSSDYSYNQIPLYGTGGVWDTAQSWLGIAAVVALAWTAVRLRHKATMLSWALLWMLATLVPTSNLLWPIGSIMAERFLYVASIGFAVALAELLFRAGAWIAARPGAPITQGRAVLVSSLVVLCAYAGRSFARNRDWHDELSLWTSTVRAVPNSYKAYRGYAQALVLRDQDEATIDAAIASGERAQAIVSNPSLPIERQENLLGVELGSYYRAKGQKLRLRGQADSAPDFFLHSVETLKRARTVDLWTNEQLRAARLRRGQPAAEIADGGNVLIYLGLGDSYLELRDWPAAQQAARYAEHLAPDLQRGYLIDAGASFYSRRLDAAATEFTMAILLDPDKPEVWGNLASCFRAMAQPAPFLQQNGQFRFDLAQPSARQLVGAAAVALVNKFVEARRANDAREWQAKLVRDYQLNPSMFVPGPDQAR